jgi:integrase
MRFLTAEQVEDLADTISTAEPKAAGHGASPHWRTDLLEYGLLIRFAAYTGLRAGEIGALRAGRLDFLRSTVEVAESATEVNGELVYGPTKNYHRRSVPLPPFLRDDLAGLLRSGPHDPDSFVFTAPEGGPLRHNNFYRRHFKPAVVRAGLPDELRFHDLRHSFAGFLIAQEPTREPSSSVSGTHRFRSRSAPTATSCRASTSASPSVSTPSDGPLARHHLIPVGHAWVTPR